MNPTLWEMRSATQVYLIAVAQLRSVELEPRQAALREHVLQRTDRDERRTGGGRGIRASCKDRQGGHQEGLGKEVKALRDARIDATGVAPFMTAL